MWLSGLLQQTAVSLAIMTSISPSGRLGCVEQPELLSRSSEPIDTARVSVGRAGQFPTRPEGSVDSMY